MQKGEQMKSIPARISAPSPSLSTRESGGWWLAVSWTIHNDGDRALYLLITGPGPYKDTSPLVLDHTIQEPDPSLSPLTPRPISFRKISAKSSVDLPERYALPAWDFDTPRPVLGRFGTSTKPPGADWEKSQPWQLIMEWQQPLESEPIITRAPAGMKPG